MQLAGNFTPAAVAGSAIPAVGAIQQFAAAPDYNAGTPNLPRDFGYRNYGMSTIGGYILINRQDRDGNWTDVTQEILSLGFTGRRLSTGAIDTPDLNNACGDPPPTP